MYVYRYHTSTPGFAFEAVKLLSGIPLHRLALPQAVVDARLPGHFRKALHKNLAR